MKKILLTLVVAIALMGAVYGAAASVVLTSPSIGAGEDAVASCATSAAIAYTTEFDNTNVQYEITDVAVTITGTCADGINVSVTLTGEDIGGATVDQIDLGTVAIATLVATFAAIADGIAVADLDDIHVLVDG